MKLALGADSRLSYAYDGKLYLCETIEDLIHAVVPLSFDTVLCDAHPSYQTTLFAKKLAIDRKVQLVSVQHHIAHAYGAAVEFGLTDFVAIVCDGLGYGSDGAIWGGEVFLNDSRVGHIELFWQLGGDSATLHPKRMLFSLLMQFYGADVASQYCDDPVFVKQFDEKFNCVQSSSCGRVFDAVACLLGISCEKGAAIELDKVACEFSGDITVLPVVENDVLLLKPLFDYLLDSDKEKSELAKYAITYIAKGLYMIAQKYCMPVVASGGCCHSIVFSDWLKGQSVKIPKLVGDEGIALGQLGYVAHLN